MIPVRSQPSETAEMETQILFGEMYVVTEQTDKWCKIRIKNDASEGWINNKLLVPISEETLQRFHAQERSIASRPLDFVIVDGRWQLPLPAGAILYGRGPNYNVEVGQHLYSYYSDPVKFNDKVVSVTSLADSFLGAPYLWGGKTMLGIDCSGFVQVLFSTIGIQLPRNAAQQAKIGLPVPTINEARQCDLAYFDNEFGKITHVGLLRSENTIIHASAGCVRIDRIDNQGIYNEERGEYTHKLRSISRLIY